MTDPRLRSTEPVDDELPFENAEGVAGEHEPENEDALVAPAAAQRARHLTDEELDRPETPSDRGASSEPADDLPRP